MEIKDSNRNEPIEYASTPVVPFEMYKEHAKRLKEKIISIGLRIPTNSRLDKYFKVISEIPDANPNQIIDYYDDPTVLLQALLEIHQLEEIFYKLSTEIKDKHIFKRLQSLCTGKPLPSNIKQNTPGRDLQLELFFATLCKSGGYTVNFEEPDLIIKSDDIQFGIAVKRPKKIKNLDRNIRKARKQIVNSGIDGIIALDISLIHESTFNNIITVEDENASLELSRKRVNIFLDYNSNRIASLAGHERVFGILVFMSILCLVGKDRYIGFSSRFTSSNLCELSDNRCDILRDFVNRTKNMFVKSE